MVPMIFLGAPTSCRRFAGILPAWRPAKMPVNRTQDACAPITVSALGSQQLATPRTESLSSRFQSPPDQLHQASSASDQRRRRTSRLPAADELRWRSIDPTVVAF